MRHDALRRVLRVLFTLEQGGRYTLYELAAEHQVCPRTIRRDLQALEAAGVPIAKSPDSGFCDERVWWVQGRHAWRAP